MNQLSYVVSLCFLLTSFGSWGQDQPIELSNYSTYETGVFDESATEIVAYDSANQLLFSTNGDSEEIDVLDISNPQNPNKVNSVDLSSYGDEPNSVALKDGYVAAAVEADNTTDKGQAVFMDVSNQNVVANVEVGFLPDMITFSPDGNKVLVANEGEPDDDYIADPMGSVSVIDISGGVSNVSQSNVTTLDFGGVNIPQDVRVFPEMQPFLGINQDFEDTTAWPNPFDTISKKSVENWEYGEFSGDNFAEINGFGADSPSSDWLVSQEINLTTADSAILSFVNARNFSGGAFKVKISTNYQGDGDPETASWDEPEFNLSSGGYEDTFSRINLDAYQGETVHLAFHYLSDGGDPGEAALIQLDDVKLEVYHPEANNLEPEYVTVSENSESAFVSLQENNALAVVDLTNNSISDILPLGLKDHSNPENAFDASDDDGKIDIKTHPTLGMYQPDAIQSYTVNGTTYIVSANEGDAREYEGTPGYEEEVDIEDLMEAGRLDINDDDIADTDTVNRFQTLNRDTTLGELDVTRATGDNDGDGLIEQLYSYGARSFSIRTASSGLIWDSKSAFEDTLASQYPNQFNNDNDENELDGRSDAKGPEPEAIELAEINDRHIAFIGLERMGGIMVYEITNPKSPQFIEYFLNRDFTVPVDQSGAGDLGPESIKYISAEASPNDTAYLATGNEVSGTISFYKLTNNMVGSSGIQTETNQNAVQVYPNPVSNGPVKFSENADYKLMNNKGKVIKQGNATQQVSLADLPNGLYFIQLNNKTTQKIIKQ